MRKITQNKILAKLLSVVLVVMMMVNLLAVSIIANAEDTTVVYYKNVNNYSSVYAYYWTKATNSGPEKWPGVAMTYVDDNVYMIEIPAGNDMIIFSNNGASQTGDLNIPATNYIYDPSKGTWALYDTSSAMPAVNASKKDGATFKSETLNVTFMTQYADTATYSINGASPVNFSGSVTLTLGEGVAVGSTISVKITATNSNGTTEQTYTYTKAQAGVVDGDGSTAPALTGKYATNPNSQVGKKASITIDGSISDWDSSMLIAQGVANDDPRVYCNSAMHEIAIDDYALYAAWDDTNLYLMWEMANVQDSVAPADNFPLTQGNLWIYNYPIILYFSVDPSIEGDGTVTSGATVWDTGVTLDANIDTVVAASTNASNGPFVYKSDDDGKIVYNDTIVSSINLKWGNETISEHLYGVDKGHGMSNNRTPGDTLSEDSAWVDFYDPSKKHSKDLDMFYEMSIPFDALGISESELTENGLGLMKVSTYGLSGMNCLPADPSMWDNATKEYSKDPSTSQEKEDADHITVPLASIGKLRQTGSGSTPDPTTAQPTTPAATTPASTTAPQPTTAQPTQPVVVDPTNVKLGDADGDGKITIVDATKIQRVLAKIESESDITLKACDTDEDGKLSILDATQIQRFLAKLLPDDTKINTYI